jgi:putative ABC transport system permease protein
MTDFSIVLRSLRARAFSTLTTVLMVGVAVGLLFVLVSMRDAGRQAFSRGTGNMHLLVTRDSSPLVGVLNAVFYANVPQRAIDWAKFQQIRDGFPLEWAIPTQQGDSYMGRPVLATTPEFFTRFEPAVGEPWRLKEGRFLRDPGGPTLAGEPKNDDADAHAFEVVVGSHAAQATGLKLYDRIHLTHGIAQSRQLGAAPAGADGHVAHVHTEYTFTVVGILEPTGSVHDRALFCHLDGGWVLHAHDRINAAHNCEDHAHGEGDKHAHDHDHEHGHGHEHEHEHGHSHAVGVGDLTDQDRLITGVLLRVATRPGQQATAAMQTVFDQLRRDATIVVAQPVQQINTLFRIVGSVDQLFIALGLAVMLSSGVGILLALYNSMAQRRRQIAVLRALGASRSRVFNLVVTESAVIGLLGAGVGLVVGVFGAVVTSALLKRELGLTITPSFGVDWMLLLVAGTVALGVLAGLVPALMAYRTAVANNLRPAA